MNIKLWFYGLFFILSSVSLVQAMDTIKVCSSFTCAVSGAGLIAQAIKNNSTFVDNISFVEDDSDPLETLYIAEWFSEVLAPLSSGTALMLTGFLLAYY